MHSHNHLSEGEFISHYYGKLELNKMDTWTPVDALEEEHGLQWMCEASQANDQVRELM
jgi:hypothetical protein